MKDLKILLDELFYGEDHALEFDFFQRLLDSYSFQKYEKNSVFSVILLLALLEFSW